ncbi:MAG: FAD-dependent oxidoreductase [Planctomycetes bacterium]|nr:FAD-dependent oxidoreductase [Planctomycetota bacterium]
MRAPGRLAAILLASLEPALAVEPPRTFDVVIVGGTPGGIMAGVAAARSGRTAVILERTRHIGGLPANGLGATDIATRGATAGLFLEFVGRIRAHYVATYGEDSAQVRASSDGYHFEPSVAETVFEEMLAGEPRLTVARMRQFDADPRNAIIEGDRIVRIRALNRETNGIETYEGRVFIDATYEGDLAAAAGAPYRLGREGAAEYGEPLAGRVYKRWGGAVGPGSTLLADNAIQAYNFRLCLTDRPESARPIERPARYDREEYASIVADVLERRTTGDAVPEGIARLVNRVALPNDKTDSNNQHLAFLSTDLPEENWPWPTSDWAWRDRFAERLRDYTLGLIWFAQHDPALPEGFRRECLRWGLARDEYADNGSFPRQVYVREGRRIDGEYLFTAGDAIPLGPNARPPIHASSITASHYPIDSHAVRKREPGRVHLDGFLSHPTRPYTVPFGAIVPKTIDNLLAPVPVSGTHLGYGTLRMEPCWMAMGEAAGIAASVAIEDGARIRDLDIRKIQARLLERGAVLIYYEDVAPSHPHFRALQSLGLRGFVPGWRARLDERASDADAARWIRWSGVEMPDGAAPEGATRGSLLQAIHESMAEDPRPILHIRGSVAVRGPYATEEGILTYWITSPCQVGPASLRILVPDRKGAAQRKGAATRRFLYVLPVEPDGETRYGDGLRTVRALDLHNRFDLIAVEPGFERLPWYADHPTDPTIRQESHLIRAVLPMVEDLFPSERPARLLVGFSKSGWGALSLLLRHPDLFAAAAAWDAPLAKERPDAWGMDVVFGNGENFEGYRVLRLLGERAAALRGSKRLAISGYGGFREHMRAAHALLESLGVPHDYSDGPALAHRWDSGWVEQAVAWLVAMVP